MALCVGCMCGTTAVNGEIDTAAKRAKLAPRRNPYWQGVSGGRGGVSLGYRKPIRGAGSWIAKIAIDGERIEERIGAADDGDGALPGALSYVAAVRASLDWGRRQYSAIEAQAGAAASASVPTVRSAVDAYITMRKQRSKHAGGNAESRLRLHVLADAKFASCRLGRLRSSTFDDWRERLPPKLKPATINRLMSDLRAALNAAVEKHRRELPGNIAAEIKVGTKALSVIVQPRHQLLADQQVKAIISAAYEVDEDFGNVVLVAAVTGARFSQVASIRVCDVQHNRLRILVPGSKKGRGGKSHPPAAIPVDVGVLHRLEVAIKGREADEPLLQRWAYRRVGSKFWEKDHRRAWGAAYEAGDLWKETIKRASVPAATIMYALRHSSIVRGLGAGLPIRLVAALHDTSVEMIEKHYAAFIVDATEELARRAALSLVA